MAEEEIMREYEVSKEDMREALAYAGELIEEEEFYRTCCSKYSKECICSFYH